ncbi:MAG: DMP19 family protein [Kofleriaceae bacterium]
MSFERVGLDDVRTMFQAVFAPDTVLEELDLIWIGPRATRDEAGPSSRLLELDVHAAAIGQRAILYYLVMRSETRRNGIDGFVWNCGAYFVQILEVFAAIGAGSAVAELCELASGLDDDEDEDTPGEAVDRFLQFRARADGPFVPSGLDPITDVRQALIDFAAQHPDQFVDA